MSEHAEPQKEELKKHGDELENALKPGTPQATSGTKTQPTTSGKTKE